ncbi:MAG: PTS sugar transporter subunit IIA [Candidatus Cloacimonetes bacterium]|jgi:mannitol/fructose-specific phosphotransferase system IIA component (Ntr-type)|nr:PTS sugar transporter subunit IIA [Candidatus Cloacimonadota bacterium]HPM01074.1 PTS sugar transporter subunit IIA [Candidatus Cloacimonadota bacterium]
MEKFPHISQYITPERVLDLDIETKEEALEALLKVINHSDLVTDKNILRNAIYAREKLMSTGIGYGIAIPHARHASVKDFVIAVGRCKNGVPCDSIDDKPVTLFLMIVASDKQDKDYLRLLSRIVNILKNKELLEDISQAENATQLYNVIVNEKN